MSGERKILVKALARIYHLIDLRCKKCDIKPSYGSTRKYIQNVVGNATRESDS